MTQSPCAAGYHFSVPPSVVRSPHMQKLVAGLPLECLVFETDSPALAAEKGGINEPANVAISCREVARLKGISFEEAAAITTQNACNLFPRLRSSIGH